MIPKEHTVFRLHIPWGDDPDAALAEQPANTYVFELYGEHLQNRAVDRATKKFKHRKLDE